MTISPMPGSGGASVFQEPFFEGSGEDVGGRLLVPGCGWVGIGVEIGLDVGVGVGNMRAAGLSEEHSSARPPLSRSWGGMALFR